jgi:hypothetical protein
LVRERNFSDLIKEESSTIRELKTPETVAQSTCERSLGMTKELAVEQFRWNCSAVDTHKGSFPPSAAFVNGSRD